MKVKSPCNVHVEYFLEVIKCMWAQCCARACVCYRLVLFEATARRAFLGILIFYFHIFSFVSFLSLYYFSPPFLNLVSKCSATPARIAVAPPEARQRFGGPNYPRHPTGGFGMGCDRALGGGGV